MDVKIGQKVIYNDKLMVVLSLVTFEEATSDGLIAAPGMLPSDFPQYELSDGQTYFFVKKEQVKPYNAFFKKLYNIKDIEINVPNKIDTSEYKIGQKLILIGKEPKLVGERIFGEEAEIVSVQNEGKFLLEIYIKFGIEAQNHKLSQDQVSWYFYQKEYFDNLESARKQKLKNQFNNEHIISLKFNDKWETTIDSEKIHLNEFIKLDTFNFDHKIELLTDLMSDEQNGYLALKCLDLNLGSLKVNSHKINEIRQYLTTHLKNNLNDKNKLLKITQELEIMCELENSQHNEETNLSRSIFCAMECVETFLTGSPINCITSHTESVSDELNQEKLVLKQIVKLLKGDI